MNIYLIGMMGTGKSMIGELLTEKLDYSFVDLDEKIEKYSEKSITEIFEKDGEENFRNLESEQLRYYFNSVIACGGGIILKEENRTFMKENGKAVLLTASIPELSKRLIKSNSRPLLVEENKEELLTKIWSERRLHYLSTADYTIETDHKTKEEIAEEILKQLNR
tara:strand:+ start:31 stop:525 length:495 start_codon:yes stop_codon:yes gene_type:complete